jgi:2-polyprenyl-3-methyl-5-hydroxy-6-metoxy-1,4-benzoquinol methylase
MDKITLRHCPLCQSQEAEILHHQKFKVFEGSTLPKEYDVVACNKCGFVFADTPADQKAYDKYYEVLSIYEDESTGTGGGCSPFDQERMNVMVQDLVQNIRTKEACILDIGAANGGVLELFKKNGFNNLTGLDPSPKCVKHMEDKGLKGYIGGIFQIPENILKNRYDFIILSHVMEHIRDLDQAMENIKALLSDNGTVYIEVPNAEEYDNYFIVPYYYFDCEHINHFDEQALINLSSNYGLEFIGSVKKAMHLSESDDYPAIGVFMKKTGKKLPKEQKKSKVKEHILNFVKMSKEKDTNKLLNRFVDSKEKVLIWGAGQFTSRLFEDTDLKKCNIMAIFDNDSVKQGKKMNGIKILNPTELGNFPYPILICSALHNEEIAADLKRAGYKNKLILVE